MKITATGIIICLISLYFLLVFGGTSLYTVGGLLFPCGAIVGVIGLFKKWK